MNKFKLLLTNIFIIIIVVFILLMIIEALLRIKNLDMKNYNIEMWKYTKELKVKSENEKLGFYHKPSTKTTLQSVDIRINNYGLRGPDITKERTHKRRILFLGSSATFGWGVSENKTMTSLIGQKMGDDIEILNAGVGNYNTVRYTELFFTKLKDLNPTDIVIHYFLNDSEDLHIEDRNWLLKNSQLAVLVWTALHVFQDNGTLLDYYNLLYRENYIGYKKMSNALDLLVDYTSKNNIRIYLTLMPDLHYLHDERMNKYHMKVKKIAIEKGFKYLDLIDSFDKNIKPEDLWVMPTDAHPNELAHELMSNNILPFLKIE